MAMGAPLNTTNSYQNSAVCDVLGIVQGSSWVREGLFVSSTDKIRRWESGALAHAVTDPFGQGPLPWLRGTENYVDSGQVVPWYVDPAHAQGDLRLPPPRKHNGPRSADDV